MLGILCFKRENHISIVWEIVRDGDQKSWEMVGNFADFQCVGTL